jgi:cell division protein ZipA
MASIMKPGSFDMANIREMETPAIAFFLTLPAPMTALDAWEDAAHRAAHGRTARRRGAGRQPQRARPPAHRHIRDELRGYDRQHQAPPLTKPPRW